MFFCFFVIRPRVPTWLRIRTGLSVRPPPTDERTGLSARLSVRVPDERSGLPCRATRFAPPPAPKRSEVRLWKPSKRVMSEWQQ